MSQIWDILKPISGVTKLSQLYQIIRDHNNSLRSGFSGTTAPSTPVVGQDWEDETTGKRYQYTNASGWSEVVRANVGIGLEIIAARGMHASLDSRLDAQINEDGTLKAATTLNPSQWYDLTVASGYISTTSFRAFGADYTTVYYPTRRLKVNNAGGASYTEVVSSSYSAPNTTVVVKDAVVAATLNYVSHSIIGPRKASGGDGAVSYEMIGNVNVTYVTSSYAVKVSDTVIIAVGTFSVTSTFGASARGDGRKLIIINGSDTETVTFDHGIHPEDRVIGYGTTGISIGPLKSLHLIPYGGNWYRADNHIAEV